MKEWFGSRPKQPEESQPEFWYDEENKVYRRVYADGEHPVEEVCAGEYEVAEQTKYGPVLRRIQSVPEPVETPNYSKPVVHDYTWPIREASKSPVYETALLRDDEEEDFDEEPEAEVYDDDYENEDEEEPNMSRRGFLRGLGALAGAATVGVAAVNALERSPAAAVSAESESLLASAEGQEQLEEAPRFSEELTGYERFAELHYKEVLFVDETNRPIGDPLPLKGFTINRRTEQGEIQPYLVSPGPADEMGILTEGIAGEWLAEMRIKLKEKHPDLKVDLKNSLPRVLSINGKFKSIVYDSTNTELIAAIKRGEITNYKEIVEHYAAKTFSDAEPFLVREYIEENIKFKPDVPELVQAELRRIIPGLCAQESNFNNASVSRSGARGIFQFMPATWKDYNDTDIEVGTQSLAAQVRSAGEFFSDLYRRVQIHAGEETMNQLRAIYDEETLQKDLLVPLTVNAYNGGAGLLGEAMKRYVDAHQVSGTQIAAKDLFLEIADYAQKTDDGLLSRYANEAREYVPRIYANTNVLQTNA